MWARYVIIVVIALLVGAVLGSYFIPTTRVRGQPAIAVFQPTPEGVESWRFAVADPGAGKVTVYEVDDGLRAIGSVEY